MSLRLGIDLGGTKTEILALGPGGTEQFRKRVPTVRDYDGTLTLLAELVREAEQQTGQRGSLGMAIPGCETANGTIKNANSTWLNGRPLRADLEARLGRPVRLANDANCFALSEASDGAAAGAGMVFGVIAGTGLGGGVVVNGRVLGGAHGVTGEWGHIPLPSPTQDEWAAAPDCYCGRRGCMETWCSGPALTRDFFNAPLNAPLWPSPAREPATASSPVETGEDQAWTAERIALSRHPAAIAAIDRWLDRLARGLAAVVNILDPDVIVMGGGLSNIARLYDELPPLVETYAFTLGSPPRIVKNRHGDSSGIRGAAWLWPGL
jgi:fructokinase